MEIKLSPYHEYLLIEYAFYEHINLKLIENEYIFNIISRFHYINLHILFCIFTDTG